MAIDLADLPPPIQRSLTIRPVEDQRTLAAWVHTGGSARSGDRISDDSAPLYEARSIGYRAGMLQSSDLGYRGYQRLGFQKFCQMNHFYRQVQNHS